MNQPKKVRKTAVALGFEPKRDPCPRVTAKGSGKLADQILELARQHDIPIREDRDLIQVLSRLDLEDEIPPQLYRAVAEILAFIYLASREYQEGTGVHAEAQRAQRRMESPSTHFSGTLDTLRG